MFLIPTEFKCRQHRELTTIDYNLSKPKVLHFSTVPAKRGNVQQYKTARGRGVIYDYQVSGWSGAGEYRAVRWRRDVCSRLRGRLT
jgi:hypothetical protein